MNGAASGQRWPKIEDLLQHRAPMLLIDRIVAADAAGLEAQFVVPAEGWYLDEDGCMPAWIGIELMAQAIAAHVGLEAQGAPPKPGVLLGTRRYGAATPKVAGGTQLGITVRLVVRDESGFAAYDCSITGPDGEWAAASVKAYQPDDFDAFLKGAVAR